MLDVSRSLVYDYHSLECGKNIEKTEEFHGHFASDSDQYYFWSFLQDLLANLHRLRKLLTILLNVLFFLKNSIKTKLSI